MAQRYQQFLGSKPGLIIEIVDDSNSPFLVRSEEGFEFRLAADDFRNYYKKEQSPTPPEWGHLITNEKTGLVDCVLMAEVMEVIHSFEPIYQDFDKARAFVREAIKFMRDRPENSLATLREWIAGSAWQDVKLSDDDLRRMLDIRKEIYPCLISELCAAGRFPFLQSSGFTGASEEAELVRKTHKIGPIRGWKENSRRQDCSSSSGSNEKRGNGDFGRHPDTEDGFDKGFRAVKIRQNYHRRLYGRQ